MSEECGSSRSVAVPGVTGHAPDLYPTNGHSFRVQLEHKLNSVSVSLGCPHKGWPSFIYFCYADDQREVSTGRGARIQEVEGGCGPGASLPLSLWIYQSASFQKGGPLELLCTLEEREGCLACREYDELAEGSLFPCEFCFSKWRTDG